MKYDHLIQAIEDGAEEKLRDFQGNKDREIREIRERADTGSEQLRKDLLAETKRKISVESNKQIYSAREQSKDHLTRARQEACLSVFREADVRLSSFRSSPSYGPFFKAVLAEIIESLDSEKIRLHIDKKDEALCRQMIKDTGKEYEIVTDLTTNGGLNGSTPDGKVMVRNTIEDRLARAKERMKVVVFSGLYGDPVVR
ncbi:MAG: V-type ATP synthase subunit E [Methanomicrobiales archaeon]